MRAVRQSLRRRALGQAARLRSLIWLCFVHGVYAQTPDF